VRGENSKKRSVIKRDFPGLIARFRGNQLHFALNPENPFAPNPKGSERLFTLCYPRNCGERYFSEKAQLFGWGIEFFLAFLADLSESR